MRFPFIPWCRLSASLCKFRQTCIVTILLISSVGLAKDVDTDAISKSVDHRNPPETHSVPFAGEFDFRAKTAMDAMRKRAQDLGVSGVGLICLGTGTPLELWQSRMIVVGRILDIPQGGDKGYNLLGIAYAKAAEAGVTLKPSGQAGRIAYVGEVGWRGAVVREWNGQVLIAAFSGAKDEVDVALSELALERFTGGQ